MIGNFELDDCYTGEAVAMLAQLPDACIDLTVTSPPYDEMDAEYNLIPGGLRTYNGYQLNFADLARQLYRVTKPGGVVMWVVGDSVVDGSETITSARQKIFFYKLGFNIHDTMIWHKKNFTNPEKKRYHQVFEYMVVLSVGAPKTFNPIIDKKNIWAGETKFGGGGGRRMDGTMDARPKRIVNDLGMRGNVWLMNTAAQENICQPNAHPAMFTEELAHDHILSWSNPGDVVLDPMCGSGTTLKQAKELGRRYIGFDISAEYIEKIAKPRVNGARVPLTGIFDDVPQVA